MCSARIWCNLDGCGLLCVLATWGMLLFSVYVVAFVLLRPTPFEECLSAPNVVTSIIFAAVAGFAATAHVRTMLTDPGAVPRYATPVPAAAEDPEATDTALDCDGGGGGTGDGEEETSRLTDTVGVGLEEGGLVAAGNPQHRQHEQENQQRQQQERQKEKEHVVKWCLKCDAFKPPRAHHCSLCQRCIVKMDHHCPWVNNCVGIGNQKLFILFCVYTCALCAFALVIEGIVVVLIGDDRRPEACRLSSADHVATVALASIALMFGMFTLCMACDQCQVASTNQTKIDRLKGEIHESGGGINEVFGVADRGRFRWHWLVPVPASFPAGDATSRILGYCTGKRAAGSSGDANDENFAGVAEEMELAEYGGIAPTGDVPRRGRGGNGRGATVASEGRLKRTLEGDFEERLGAMLDRGSSDYGSERDFR